jgi:peptide subunit release factor 1 (eRF1)
MLSYGAETSSFERILNYQLSTRPVVSVYLMVDRLRTSKKNYQTMLNSMIAGSRERLENDINIDRNDKKEIYEIFEKVKRFVSDKFRTDSTRTLAIFSSGDGIWEEFRLPVIMRSKIVIDPKPYTQNIRNLVNNSKRYGVLMIDREKAQINSIYLGEVSKCLAEFESDVPPKVNFRSQAAFREKKLLGRMEEKLHHFFKTINDKTLELFKEKKFDYLILSGRKEIIPKFMSYMHSYLESVLIGSIFAEPDSKFSLATEKAREVIDKFEQGVKDSLTNRLIDELNPNGMGVLGIDAIIRSLLIEQIKTLVYDRQFAHKGYVCDDCGYITLEKRDRCPYCDGQLTFYNDIVDEIVEDALDQGCEVVDIEGNDRLIKAGSIGAVLRYKL